MTKASPFKKEQYVRHNNVHPHLPSVKRKRQKKRKIPALGEEAYIKRFHRLLQGIPGFFCRMDLKNPAGGRMLGICSFGLFAGIFVKRRFLRTSLFRAVPCSDRCGRQKNSRRNDFRREPFFAARRQRGSLFFFGLFDRDVLFGHDNFYG